MQQLSRAHQGGEQITSLSRQVLGDGGGGRWGEFRAGTELIWIICFRGSVTEVLRELTWDTLWDLDLGACPRSKAVVLLSKKKKMATATTMWLDLSADTSDDWPLFHPPFPSLFTNHPILRVSKGAVNVFLFRLADRSGVESWCGVCALRMDQRVPSEDVWRLGALF